MLKFAYADSPHGQIHYGTVGVGEALIMLPASPRSWGSFQALLPLLSDHFRIIVVDTLGFGSSACMPASGTMQQIGEGVLAVMDDLNLESANVFGIHTGHKVAAAMVAIQPKRIKRLIICGKTHSIIPNQENRNAAIMARIQGRTFINEVDTAGQKLTPIDWARVYKSVTSMWWHDELFSSGGDPKLVDALRRKIADELIALPSSKAVYRANFLFDFEAAMRSTQAQTLIIELCNTYEDKLYGRQGKALAGMMTDARAVELPVVDEAGLGMNADEALIAKEILSFLN